MQYSAREFLKDVSLSHLFCSFRTLHVEGIEIEKFEKRSGDTRLVSYIFTYTLPRKPHFLKKKQPNEYELKLF